MIQEFRPWLVQRISKPRTKLNPNSPTLVQYYAHPKTEETRKQNELALKELGLLIPLDYMGAAEFEFGAVAKALRELCSQRADLIAFSQEVQGYPYSWETPAKEYTKNQPKSSRKVAGWCLRGHENQLREFLLQEATDDSRNRLKERTGFQEICFGHISAIRNKNGTISKRQGFQTKEGSNCALFDLGNYWFVTTDEQQLIDLKHLLGIQL
jgi:hypothetical protein